MTVSDVRAQFPALATGFAYLENAGGSQVTQGVADAIREYMVSNYVQLGAGYPQANDATETVDAAHNFMNEFVNGTQVGSVVLGPSTTALIQRIANAYGERWEAGDEVVIAETNHEANAGGWERLARFGIKPRIWPLNPSTFRCELDDLEPLLNKRTKLVALPHVSNIVGQIEDVASAAKMAHQAGAKVCVDGVAFAPHCEVDVATLEADWYVFSCYKVYGPHMAALFGRHEAFAEITGPNHSFIPKDTAYKWELGGASHEGCAGLLALRDYFGFLAGEEYAGHSTVAKAFSTIRALEQPLEARLRSWLGEQPDLRLLGPKAASSETVGTVSFVHSALPSSAISAFVNRCNIGIRHGNMYAVRLLEALKIPPDPGVVRVSVVHYNTEEEVERAIDALATVMFPC